MQVSVAMPVKDTPSRFLWPAVDSVMDQTGVRYELIIVDDGSKDPDTVEALKDIEARYSGGALQLHWSGGVGLGPARNLANRYARAPLIAPLDSDDVMEPARLYKQVRYLKGHPDVDLVSGEMIHIGPDGRAIERTSYHSILPSVKDPAKRINYICHGASMYRLDAIQEVGGYDDIERSGEDWRLWHRLIERGEFNFDVLADYFIRRRVWGGNASYEDSDMLQRLHREWANQ